VIVALSLYPYQQRVKDLIQGGQSVILQAPTGAGKTRAALAPFIEAFFDLPDEAFPKQCLYTVPMRVLANQFEHEYRMLAESYERRFHRLLQVTIQTGERANDPKLEGDLVFATLDQVLSSALGVPYSLSEGQSNINVGAIWGSYLVLDEFHLFPLEARNTTLQLLKVFGRFVPFILMTATFSRTMLEEIAALLGAKPELLAEKEIEAIERRDNQPRKERRFRIVSQAIIPQMVLDKHDRRSLVVCNTVERALEVYEGLVQAGCRAVPFTTPDLVPLYGSLRAASNSEEHRRLLERAVYEVRDRCLAVSDSTPWVMLLHSRFELPHRQVKEALLRTLWGPDEKEREAVPSLIVVATQVVEVGLDITSQTLHTEVAPAASVLQRAGRCARYPGEQGQVYVYQVLSKQNGEPNYAPYDGSNMEKQICERTWEALTARHDTVVHFSDEQDIINTTHDEADRETLRRMKEDEGGIWGKITQAVAFREASVRRELIRPLDSRTLIVYEPPDGLTEESPFRFEGFSLWHGTLRGKLEALWQQAQELGLLWTLRYPIQQKDEEDSRALAVYKWQDAKTSDDISSALLFAVHPALVAYDAEQGFRLGVAGDCAYHSPEVARLGKRPGYDYSLESYSQHILAMHQTFDERFRKRLAWLARRLSQTLDGKATAELLERAVQLAMALHDVGKLEERWQRWAAKYQEHIGEGRPPFLVAHTHYEHNNPLHKEAKKKVTGRPPHAGEGAHASMCILWETLGKQHRGLYRATVTAIARHHSPGLYEANPYWLHPDAPKAVAEALAAAGEVEGKAWAQWLILSSEGPNLEKRLLQPWPEDVWEDWLMYFVIVRYLRLCEGTLRHGDKVPQ
jgi:CRISPR-associated endonuclease/helicase Cas3